MSELMESLKDPRSSFGLVSVEEKPEDQNQDINQLDFEDVDITRVISDQKVTIYSGYSSSNDMEIVLKVYPIYANEYFEGFLRESRFFSMRHKNIIIFHQIANQIDLGGVMASAIFMEQAQLDFLELLPKITNDEREKIVRTFFHNLIDGLQYLHDRRIAHLDLKLENLLLSKDYELKIADFENAYIEGDLEMKSKGTKNFRSPEMINGTITNPFLSDLYSAGLVLFVLRFGVLAYTEDNPDVTIFKMFRESPEKYYEIVSQSLENAEKTLTDGFKSLFLGMTNKDPKKRKNFDEIRQNEWFKGPILNKEDLKNYIKI